MAKSTVLETAFALSLGTTQEFLYFDILFGYEVYVDIL